MQDNLIRSTVHTVGNGGKPHMKCTYTTMTKHYARARSCKSYA